jgi:hypothetical protein
MTPLCSQSGQCQTDHDLDLTVMGDPEASLDLRFSSLREFNVRGFWCYDTSVLPKWSMMDKPWRRSNGQGRSRVPSDLWLALLRDR